MSLLVWLPLINDNHNQGLLNLTPTDLGTVSYINGGKIGKCLSAGDGTSSTGVNGLSYNSNLVEELGTEFSCAVWVKPLGNHLHYEGAIISSGNWNSTCWAFGLNQDNTAVDVFSKNYNRNITCSVPINQWTHLCCTSDNGIVKLYKNGEYVGSTTQSTTLASDATNFTVGRETYASGYFSFNGNLNDLRIYNHVLSLKEIKELAKGLVCHYPLSGNGRGGDNIMPNSATMNLGTSSAATGTWRDAGSSTMTKSRVQIYDKVYGFQNVGVQTANDGSCYGIDSFPMEANTDYVISMDARITAGTEGYAGFALYDYTPLDGSYSKVDKNYYVTPLTTSWTRCWLHFKTGSNTARNVYIGVTTGSTSVTTQMCKVKIEKGSIPTPWIPKSTDAEYIAMGYDSTTEYDTSGYNYHGTRNNTFTWDSNAARYSVSTVFNGSDNSIQIPFCQALGLTASGKTDYTWACWIYVSTLSSKGYATILGGQSGFEAETKYNSDGTPKLWAYSWGSNSYSYNLNEWVHIAATQTSTESKWYVNGELAFTGSSANIPYGNFFIGSWRDTNSQNFKGNVSDFRIYATALSADDIKELYDTVASVTNNGTLLTRGEFIET